MEINFREIPNLPKVPVAMQFEVDKSIGALEIKDPTGLDAKALLEPVTNMREALALIAVQQDPKERSKVSFRVQVYASLGKDEAPVPLFELAEGSEIMLPNGDSVRAGIPEDDPMRSRAKAVRAMAEAEADLKRAFQENPDNPLVLQSRNSRMAVREKLSVYVKALAEQQGVAVNIPTPPEATISDAPSTAPTTEGGPVGADPTPTAVQPDVADPGDLAAPAEADDAPASVAAPAEQGAAPDVTADTSDSTMDSDIDEANRLLAAAGGPGGDSAASFDELASQDGMSAPPAAAAVPQVDATGAGANAEVAPQGPEGPTESLENAPPNAIDGAPEIADDDPLDDETLDKLTEESNRQREATLAESDRAVGEAIQTLHALWGRAQADSASIEPPAEREKAEFARFRDLVDLEVAESRAAAPLLVALLSDRDMSLRYGAPPTLKELASIAPEFYEAHSVDTSGNKIRFKDIFDGSSVEEVWRDLEGMTPDQRMDSLMRQLDPMQAAKLSPLEKAQTLLLMEAYARITNQVNAEAAAKFDEEAERKSIERSLEEGALLSAAQEPKTTPYDFDEYPPLDGPPSDPAMGSTAASATPHEPEPTNVSQMVEAATLSQSSQSESPSHSPQQETDQGSRNDKQSDSPDQTSKKGASAGAQSDSEGVSPRTHAASAVAAPSIAQSLGAAAGSVIAAPFNFGKGLLSPSAWKERALLKAKGDLTNSVAELSSAFDWVKSAATDAERASASNRFDGVITRVKSNFNALDERRKSTKDPAERQEITEHMEDHAAKLKALRDSMDKEHHAAAAKALQEAIEGVAKMLNRLLEHVSKALGLKRGEAAQQQSNAPGQAATQQPAQASAVAAGPAPQPPATPTTQTSAGPGMRMR